VSLHGNTYEVDAALVGRRVELVFNPFDLTELSVRYQDRDMGAAIPHQIGRHVHPSAKPETGPDPAPATGIDYLGLVRDRHTTALAQRVNYAGLTAQPTRADTGADGIGGIGGIGEVDSVLEAELASFAALTTLDPSHINDDVHPDQLDLLELLDTDDNQEHQ